MEKRKKKSSNPRPRSTSSSTPISTILVSLVMIHNRSPTQTYDTQIHQLDDSTRLKISTFSLIYLIGCLKFYYVGWMRGTLVNEKSPSPSEKSCKENMAQSASTG